MQISISIDSIIIPPRMHPAEDSKGLSTKIPILVTPQGSVDGPFILIDGLRRLNAAKQLNRTEIWAEVVHTFKDACSNLSTTHKGNIITTRRIFEIYMTLVPLMNLYRYKSQGKKQVLAREILYEALGLSSRITPSEFSAILQMYRAADLNRIPLAIKMVEVMERGDLSPHAARQQYSRKRFGDPRALLRGRKVEPQGSVLKASDQRQIVNTAIATLSGVTKGLNELGPWSTQISRQELDSWVKELVAQRTLLNRTIRLARTSTLRSSQDG